MFEDLKHTLLNEKKPSEYFEFLRNSNTLDNNYAELSALIGVLQNAQWHQEGDVYAHTMMILDEAAKCKMNSSNPFGFMLSALCHDLGKAVCTEVINGAVHAYQHEVYSREIAGSFLNRIGTDIRTIAYTGLTE